MMQKKETAAITVLFLLLSQGQFVCQSTIDTYNAHVNVGNFTGAAALTFADSVKYIIPGPTKECPYCAVYDGKTQVISLFVDGFLGHFTIVNPLVNLREITSNSGGPNNVPELIDFNDESFRTLPQFGGKYFRVHVIHDFLFDSNCMITQMHLYHDPYVAAMAFAGYATVAVPIMPGLAQIPPPNQFVVTTLGNLNNWQVFNGETSVPPAEAWATVNQYYNLVANGNLNSQTFSDVFISLDYTLPQNLAGVMIPGNSDALPWAGLYLDKDEIVTYHQTLAANAKENTPLSDPLVRNITSAGSVVVIWHMKGASVKYPKQTYISDAVDYFQLIRETSTNKVKIARLSRFFDTWNVTLAVNNGEPYPQYTPKKETVTKTVTRQPKTSREVVTVTARPSPQSSDATSYGVHRSSLFLSLSSAIVVATLLLHRYD